MTKKELSHLYWLKKEIQWQKQKLKTLQTSAEKCTSTLFQVPTTRNNHESTVEKYGVLIAEQEQLIETQIKQALTEYNRLHRYIVSVEDPQARLILSFRYLDGLSWQQIARRVGGNNTSDSVRKYHDRFLSKS